MTNKRSRSGILDMNDLFVESHHLFRERPEGAHETVSSKREIIAMILARGLEIGLGGKINPAGLDSIMTGNGFRKRKASVYDGLWVTDEGIARLINSINISIETAWEEAEEC